MSRRRPVIRVSGAWTSCGKGLRITETAKGEKWRSGGGSTSAIKAGDAGLRRVVLVLTKQDAPSQSGDCGKIYEQSTSFRIDPLSCTPA